jgi:hypothetical protein
MTRLEQILNSGKVAINDYLSAVSTDQFTSDLEEYRNSVTAPLRDQFAGQAMQGIIASNWKNVIDWDGIKETAKHSYKIADAMLKAREEK